MNISHALASTLNNLVYSNESSRMMIRRSMLVCRFASEVVDCDRLGSVVSVLGPNAGLQQRDDREGWIYTMSNSLLTFLALAGGPYHIISPWCLYKTANSFRMMRILFVLIYKQRVERPPVAGVLFPLSNGRLGKIAINVTSDPPHFTFRFSLRIFQIYMLSYSLKPSVYSPVSLSRLIF